MLPEIKLGLEVTLILRIISHGEFTELLVVLHLDLTVLHYSGNALDHS